MSHDQSEPVNPYAATSASIEPSSTVTSQRSYGGIGRLAYFGYSFLAGVVYTLVEAGVSAVGNEGAAIFLLPMILAYLGVLLWIVALRMINTGYSPWWCVGMFVPFLNILVGIRCIACPEGYADHRTLDTAGKIIVGLFFAMFALIILALVVGGLG